MNIRFIATAALLTLIKCTLAQQKPPVIEDDYANTQAGIPIAVNVLENDYGMHGHKIKIYHAINGQVTHNDSTIFYNPPISFSGEKMIKYILIDETNGLFSEPGQLWVNVSNQNSQYINANNIDARINSSGVHFYIPDGSGNSHFYVPKNTIKSTFLSLSLWIGGLDSNNILHFAGDKYQNYGMDFFPGPISDIYDSSYQKKWNKVWKMSTSDIEYHKNNWWKDDYTPTTTIATWPTHSDLHKRSIDLIAPFEDVNSNGIYDPMEGDYPVIKGDQAIFFILNDDKQSHTGSYGNKLGVEVHGIAYAYDCPCDSSLQNTIFFHYIIINKSNITYDNTFIGFFADMNIGFFMDDYMQTDVKRNSLIGYNGNNIDGMGYIGNEYLEHPPAQSLTILKGPLNEADGIDNPGSDILGNPLCDHSYNGQYFGDGIIDNECMGISYSSIYTTISGPMSDPYTAWDYYRNMQGKWKDHSVFQYGGDGYNLSSNVGPDCRYLYPGASDSVNYGTNGQSPIGGYNTNGFFWTEASEDNYPGDRRGSVSMGPINFKPGDIKEIDLALVFGIDYQRTGNLAALDILDDRIDKIIENFQKDSISCEPISFNNEVKTKKNNIKIWSTENTVHITNPENAKGKIRIYNLYGQKILETRLNGNINQVISFDKPTGHYIVKITGEEFVVSTIVRSS